MRKSLTALSLAAALFAGQALADQATLDALQAAGVVLTPADAAAVAEATGDQLVAIVAQLAAANPDQASVIEAAAIQASPHLADQIKEAIRVALAGVGLTPSGTNGITLPSNSIPSAGGSGGGGNPAGSVASPN